MQGEYRGDFTRDTFDPKKGFLRVLYQQGRVQLDADFNEQASILLRYLQSLAKDLYGPFGGPCKSGFEITGTGSSDRNFNISAGHYYVDGILCEANLMPAAPIPTAPTYLKQPDYPVPEELENKTTYLVYLDVWERHVTYIEEDSIREVALGGPDTATRAQVVWQVKVENELPDGIEDISEPNVTNNWEKWVALWQPNERGMLKAQARKDPKEDTDPCITSPESRYRGAENQLYRVEIHTRGKAGPGATFKWSRENGSVTYPIEKVEANMVGVEHLGRDSRFGLTPGDWVEIVDDDYILQNRAEPLLQVDAIDRDTRQVTLKSTPSPNVGQDPGKHPLLRRWDHKAGKSTKGGLELMGDGAAKIVEGTNDNNWLLLEDGVMVQFQRGASYRTGDYWLIPARTATGDVEWPGDVGNPEAIPPHGVEHHYAPLAIINVDDGAVTRAVDGDGDLRSQKELGPCPVVD